MGKNNKPLRDIILVLLLVPFVILIIAIYPFIHNEHISSLGRFSKTIEIGHNEDKVFSAFKAFQEKHSSTTEINDIIAVIDLYGRNIQGRRIISLHQESLFDNIELRVLFEDHTVAQKIFISD